MKIPSVTVVVLGFVLLGLMEAGCQAPKKPDMSSLSALIASGDADALEALLAGGVSLASNKTVLAEAMAQLEIPDLYTEGIPPTDPDSEEGKKTWEPRLRIARLLIEHGADLETPCQYGETPLLVAFRNHHYDLAELLIVKGANVNERSKEPFWEGETPLLWAIPKPALVRLLLDRKCEIDGTNSSGETALLRAAGNRCYETAELLIKRGSNVNLGGSGDSVLVSPVQGGDPKMVEILIKAGADVNATIWHGNVFDEKGHHNGVRYWSLLKEAEYIRQKNDKSWPAHSLSWCDQIIKLLKDAGARSEVTTQKVEKVRN